MFISVINFQVVHVYINSVNSKFICILNCNGLIIRYDYNTKNWVRELIKGEIVEYKYTYLLNALPKSICNGIAL